MKAWILLLPLLLVLAPLSFAQYVIDFEDFNLQGQQYLDVAESLVIPNAGGSTMTVTINAGADNRIYDLALFAGYVGQSLIDWPWPSGSNPAGTDILFDSAVNFFSIEAGDFGSDDDSPLQITAYDINNQVVGSDSVPWPSTAFPPFAVLTIQAAGIVRVHFSSGGPYANSVFLDNITFEGGFTLDVAPDPLVAGQTGTFTASGGDPVTNTYLAYSLVGPGSTFVPFLSVTLDLAAPKQGGGTIVSDAQGTAVWNLPVPAGAAGRNVWLQAAQFGQVTNLVATSIL